MKRTKRQCLVSTRTMKHIKGALREDAERQNRTESDLLHVILSRHYGFDPITGEARDTRRPEIGAGSARRQEVKHD